MAENKFEVSKIGITIGQRRIELSVKEARKLLRALRELFRDGKPGDTVTWPIQIPQSLRPWNDPNTTWTSRESSGKLESLEWKSLHNE